MQENKISVLCTRPLSSMLIQKAALKNIEVNTISFIQTKPVNSNKLIKEIQLYAGKEITVVFTSMNAVEAVIKKLTFKPTWNIYCLGGITKELVSDFFGESSISATARNATALAEKIILSDNINHLIFFCGDHRLDELPEKLKANHIEVEEVVVYTTIQTPVSLGKDYNSIIFFSPSAVHSFFSINTIPTNVVLFSIGKTTTETIHTYCSNFVITSEWPGKEQMIEQVMRYFDTINQAL